MEIHFFVDLTVGRCFVGSCSRNTKREDFALFSTGTPLG